jgi:hypothetical protein
MFGGRTFLKPLDNMDRKVYITVPIRIVLKTEGGSKEIAKFLEKNLKVGITPDKTGNVYIENFDCDVSEAEVTDSK